MAILLNVPSIVCSGCGDTITKAIKTVDSGATVNVDVAAKTVTVEAQASQESISQAVVAKGHTVQDWYWVYSRQPETGFDGREYFVTASRYGKKPGYEGWYQLR